MRILLYDDERAELQKLYDILTEILQDRNIPAEICTAASADELWGHLLQQEPDVVFLDIYLEQDIMGTDLAIRLRKERHDFKLVFVSFSNSFAAESYRAGADYYLLKPLTREAVEQAMAKLHLLEAGQCLTVDTGRRYLTLNVQKVIMVEVDNKSCYIHTASGVIKEFCPLYVFDELLQWDCFFKVNRSTIVNMNYVERLEGNVFCIKGGLRVTMRSRESKQVRDVYLEWMFRHI